MTEVYDSIGKNYEIVKNKEWRHVTEEYTLLKLVDYENKTLLDLACGHGHYTRKFAQKCRSVCGVDISSEMIKLCREHTKDNIVYLCKDAKELHLDQKFDIILCSFLFNYANSEDDLRKFVQTVKNHLKEDGICIGVNDNPMQEPPYPDYKSFGFQKTRKEGSEILYSFFEKDEKLFEFSNFHHSKEVYEKVFDEADMKINWIQCEIDSNAKQELKDISQQFLSNPPFIFFVIKFKNS